VNFNISDITTFLLNSIYRGLKTPCCFQYTTVKIPPKQIDKVEKTSPQCPMPAFV
uniref:Chemokine interleukin-8-like domain-containing protein n=1 Tax=Astyanax mexicanus TaxID=7994 RepID=A0A3B1IW82_ASTMX